MIRPRYAFMLAKTKLRSKRGVLITTILISSLLFAVLIAAITIFTGAEKSTLRFVKAANNNQYLVKVAPVIPGGSVPGYDAVNLTADSIKAIRAYEANYYAANKAMYAKLGITYTEPDPADSLLTANAYADPSTPTDLRYRLNFSSSLMPSFDQAQTVAYVKTAKNTLDSLKNVAANYGGGGYYTTGTAPLASIPSQILIMDGKETLSDRSFKTGDASSYGYSTNGIHNSMYEIQDQKLVARYLTDTTTDRLKGIPVIVTAQEAVALFGKAKGISAEPASDTAKQTWLKDVQQKLTDYTYQTCYRNQAEQTILTKIQQDYADIEAHKNDVGYTKPALIYDYPSTACGDLTVKSDTRTKAEKDAVAAQIAIQKKLGTYQPPAHQVVTYQIVGFIEAEPYSDANKDVTSYLNNLLSYHTDLMGGIIPSQMYQAVASKVALNALEPTLENPDYEAAQQSLAPHVVAFSTVEQARSFMNNETCPSSDLNCKKLFTSSPYGSNYLILDEVGALFGKFMSYALPVVMLLAGFIVWFMMSRVMADNRKETAVYRAMGARRIDIAAIYLTHTLIVAVCIATVSLLSGILIAYIIDHTYGAQLGATASIAFGVGANDHTFTLFDLTSPTIVYVCLAIVILCFIAVIQPLVRNVLRPPIRDMRTE